MADRWLEERVIGQPGDRRQPIDRNYCSRSPEAAARKSFAFGPSLGIGRHVQRLAYPPPGGPGLRVKLYWLQRRKLYWPQKMGGPVVHPNSSEQFELTQQKAVDVGLAFHLMRSYSRKHWKKLLFAGGDGDFHEVVQHLVESENVSLVLIGTIDTISEDLRPYASAFVDVSKEAPDIAR